MQIIENWSEVVGTVISARDVPQPKGFVALELAVESVREVEGFANLLADAAGGHLVVHVPQALAASIDASPGRRLSCRVRRADLRQSFVDPRHFTAALDSQ